ncbi:MAG: FtsB family cell division protein [Actinomycetota bacterium]
MSGRAALSHDRRPLALRHALFVAGFLIIAFLATGPMRELLAQQERLDQLARAAARIEARNADLRGQIERLGDDAYLEQRARECLGMVRPGELPVVRAGEPAAC